MPDRKEIPSSDRAARIYLAGLPSAYIRLNAKDDGGAKRSLRATCSRCQLWVIFVPSTFRHSRMKAARPVQPFADTMLPSTWASVGPTSI